MAAKHYELIVFDWDGTLADSVGMIVNILQQAAVEIGLAKRPAAQVRNLIGLGLEEAGEQLYNGLTPEQVADWRMAYQRIYAKQQHHTLLFAGARELLEQLRSQGYDLAVATGKSRLGLDQALLETQTASLFNCTRCVDEAPSKPAPDMLDDIFLKTATLPEAALMIGDTTYDMQMARAAVTTAVGVTSGVHNQQQLVEAGAQAILANVSELPAWLQAQI